MEKHPFNKNLIPLINSNPTFYKNNLEFYKESMTNNSPFYKSHLAICETDMSYFAKYNNIDEYNSNSNLTTFGELNQNMIDYIEKL